MKVRQVESRFDFPEGAWSPSSLNQYVHICPLQYHFQRVQRLKSETITPNLGFGSSIDEVMKTFYIGRRDGKTPTQKQLQEVFDARWTEEKKNPKLVFKPGDGPENWEEKGVAVIRLALREAPEEDVIATDSAFVLEPHLEYSDGRPGTTRPGCGIADMIAGGNGSVKIIDFKTSTKSPNRAEKRFDIQPTFYSYGYHYLFPQARGHIEFVYHYYILTKTPKFETITVQRTVADFDRMVRLAEAVEKQLKLGFAIPRRSINNWACAGCGYQRPCDAWAQTVQIPA